MSAVQTLAAARDIFVARPFCGAFRSTTGSVCALGAIAEARGDSGALDLERANAWPETRALAEALGVRAGGPYAAAGTVAAESDNAVSSGQPFLIADAFDRAITSETEAV